MDIEDALSEAINALIELRKVVERDMEKRVLPEFHASVTALLERVGAVEGELDDWLAGWEEGGW